MGIQGLSEQSGYQAVARLTHFRREQSRGRPGEGNPMRKLGWGLLGKSDAGFLGCLVLRSVNTLRIPFSFR